MAPGNGEGPPRGLILSVRCQTPAETGFRQSAELPSVHDCTRTPLQDGLIARAWPADPPSLPASTRSLKGGLFQGGRAAWPAFSVRSHRAGFDPPAIRVRSSRQQEASVPPEDLSQFSCVMPRPASGEREASPETVIASEEKDRNNESACQNETGARLLRVLRHRKRSDGCRARRCCLGVV